MLDDLGRFQTTVFVGRANDNRANHRPLIGPQTFAIVGKLAPLRIEERPRENSHLGRFQDCARCLTIRRVRQIYLDTESIIVGQKSQRAFACRGYRPRIFARDGQRLAG